MDDANQGCLSDRALEEYSLDGLPDSRLAAVEEHLMLCAECRARLHGIELLKYIHYTEDGLVYARITKLMSDHLMARQWGQNLHAERRFGNFYAAEQFLSDLFLRMYPGHTCQGACGSPAFADETNGLEFLSLTGNEAACTTDFFARILRDMAILARLRTAR